MKALNKPKAATIIIILVISVASLLPFYIMLMMTTYDTNRLYTGILLTPGNYLLNNVRKVLTSNFGIYFFNSFYIAMLSSLISVISSILCGYSLAKFKFRMRKAIFNFVLITMMIPGNLGIVAFIRLMRQFGWINTHYPLIIPAVANSFGVFWMTQFIKEAVPDEVIQAAKIDGASEIQCLLRIVLPFLKAAAITLFMLSFVYSWNNFLLPLIILNKPELYTVTLGIWELANLYKVDIAAQILALTVSLFPLFVIFLFSAKYFVSGLTSGAVKG